MGAHQYNERMTILRDNGVTGSDGSWEANWINHLREIPCRVQIKSGQDLVIRDRITSRIKAAIYTAINDITTKDRIVYDSELYNIDMVRTPANRFMLISAERNTEEEAPD